MARTRAMCWAASLRAALVLGSMAGSARQVKLPSDCFEHMMLVMRLDKRSAAAKKSSPSIQ
eukprot:581306-Alexandrium_andersonii.AAC.1